MDDCSKHKKEVAGIEVDELAQLVGDLHYMALAKFLSNLGGKLLTDSFRDKKNGRIKLAKQLLKASENIDKAAENILEVWQISKPFMNTHTSK